MFVGSLNGKVARAYGSRGSKNLPSATRASSQWVWSNRQEAGIGTATLPASATLTFRSWPPGGIVGVLGLTPDQADRFDGIDQRRQVDAFAAQLALAMERAELAEETERARRKSKPSNSGLPPELRVTRLAYRLPSSPEPRARSWRVGVRSTMPHASI